MRIKKSFINATIGMLTFILAFIPIFIVRKVFVETLGIQLLGLISLYSNIIGYLTIIEMGIGIAIICSLYKPFAENNKVKVVGYLKYYEKFYKYTALIIFVLGLILVPFLHIFIKGSISITLVRVGFILVIINTVITYIFGYKQCMLNVAQEGYKISIGLTTAKIIIAILQIVALNLYHNFYYYLIIQVVINLIFYALINYYIDRRYPWIKVIKGKIEKDEKKELMKTVKGIFFHKIGSILVVGTDNIVISAFVGLAQVASYNNYIIIINAFSGVIGVAMDGITSSIGNLLIDKNEEHIYLTHKRLFFVNFWVASCIAISLFNTITPFIKIWMGKEYELGILTVSIIIINAYFDMLRAQVEKFKSASGEFYKDRFAPLVEGGINLIISIILVQYMGVAGVMIGTLISNITVIFWTQPAITYKYVFKKPLIEYFKRYFKYLLIGIVPLIITIFLTKGLKQNIDIIKFALNCLINLLVVNLFYLIIFWRNKEFEFFKGLIINVIRKK